MLGSLEEDNEEEQRKEETGWGAEHVFNNSIIKVYLLQCLKMHIYAFRYVITQTNTYHALKTHN